MGQRHQVFLKVHNPIKMENVHFSDEEMIKAKKMFGNAKTTVLAFHHQWLYGQSAVAMLANFFNVTNVETAGSKNPFNKDAYIFNLTEYISYAKTLLEAQTNPKHPRGIGIEKMTFLNEECIDENGKYSSRWDMRKDCTVGDNNDGITIVDTIERKYCMMNISESSYGGGADSLPFMEPVSALDYAVAYYPDKKDLEDNKDIVSDVDEFDVLTLGELKKIFPKVFKKDLELSK